MRLRIYSQAHFIFLFVRRPTEGWTDYAEILHVFPNAAITSVAKTKWKRNGNVKDGTLTALLPHKKIHDC
jgi:hypothetical protein